MLLIFGTGCEVVHGFVVVCVGDVVGVVVDNVVVVGTVLCCRLCWV